MAKNLKVNTTVSNPCLHRAAHARKFGVRSSFEVFGHEALNHKIFVTSTPPVGRRIKKDCSFKACWFAPPQKKGARESTNFANCRQNAVSAENGKRGNLERAGLVLAGGSSRSSAPMSGWEDVDSKPSPRAISTQGVLVVQGAG